MKWFFLHKCVYCSLNFRAYSKKEAYPYALWPASNLAHFKRTKTGLLSFESLPFHTTRRHRPPGFPNPRRMRSTPSSAHKEEWGAQRGGCWLSTEKRNPKHELPSSSNPWGPRCRSNPPSRPRRWPACQSTWHGYLGRELPHPVQPPDRRCVAQRERLPASQRRGQPTSNRWSLPRRGRRHVSFPASLGRKRRGRAPMTKRKETLPRVEENLYL